MTPNDTAHNGKALRISAGSEAPMREQISLAPIRCKMEMDAVGLVSRNLTHKLAVLIGFEQSDFDFLHGLLSCQGITLIGVGNVPDALAVIELHEPGIVLLRDNGDYHCGPQSLNEALQERGVAQPLVCLCDASFLARMCLQEIENGF